MENDNGQEPEVTPTSPEAQPTEDAPQQTVSEPQGEDTTQTQDELPEEGLKERTKERIQHFSEKARTAEEALEDLRQRKSVFDEFMPQQQAPQFTPQYQPPQLQQYTDENGNVDIGHFDESMRNYHQTMQYGTQQAMATAQQTARRIQEREAYTKYPELDPVSKTHDDDFKRLVAATMAMHWSHSEDVSLVEVADEVAKTYAKRQTEEAVAKKAVEKYKEAQQDRQQGPVEKARGVQREEIGADKLREVSRRGTYDQQQDALAERLRRIG